MKKLFTILAMCSSMIISAQCSIQAVVVDTACYCDGSAQAINPVGTPPFQYQWNFGDTTALTSNYLCGGNTYIVTMTDSTGCSATDTVVALGNVMIQSHSVSNTSCFTCCDGTDTAHANVLVPNCGPLMYQWSPGQQWPTTDSIAQNLCQGTYTVVITDQCGCGGAYICFIAVDNPTAVNHDPTTTECNVIITDDQIFIQSGSELQVAEFFDLTGKLVARVEIGSKDASIDRPRTTSALLLRISGEEVQRTQFIPPRQ